MLYEVITKKGVALILAGAKPGIVKVLSDSGMIKALHPDNIVPRNNFV